MHDLSYENDFYLCVTQNSFSSERLRTRPGFEEKDKDNPEMVCHRNVAHMPPNSPPSQMIPRVSRPISQVGKNNYLRGYLLQKIPAEVLSRMFFD